MDTSVRLKHRGGFTLGLIEGTERLCPGCRRPTAVVSAWIKCGDCNEQLTSLTPSEQEPLTYSVDLQSADILKVPEEIQRRTVLEWGLDYPYVPQDVIDKIEDSWAKWKEDVVWDFMHVPKPLWGTQKWQEPYIKGSDREGWTANQKSLGCCQRS